MTLHKATRPDGTDFRTGTIDYAAALASGEVIRHPARRKRRDDPTTYLSVSTSPTDCTGMAWPCRLFVVEPVGRVMTDLSASPSLRAVSALRVVEELPSWQALGPQGQEVAALIERAGRLTDDEVARLAAARETARAAAWSAAWTAARGAAWRAAWRAAVEAARVAAWRAAREAAWTAAGAAAGEAAWALVVRDLILPEAFDVVYGPWARVMEADR